MPTIVPCAQQVKTVIPFQFVALPVELLRRTDLSAAAKLLAAVVLDVSRGARSATCKLTNASLGARIGRSAASVKRLLAELETAGIVRRDTVAEGRVRTAVAVTWVDRESTTEQPSAAQDQPTGGSGMTHQVARDQPTIQSRESETLQTGPILSDSRGEKTPDPKPSPAEVAAAMRAMVGGRYSSAMFDAPAPAPVFAKCEKPPAPPGDVRAWGGCTIPTPSPGVVTVSPPPARPKGPQELWTLDPRSMARRVGYSALAAIVQSGPPRKGRDQQLAELAATRHRREAQASR